MVHESAANESASRPAGRAGTWAAPVVASLVLAAALWWSWRFMVSMPGIDYYPVWIAVHSVRAGEDPDIRGFAAQRRIGDYARKVSLDGRPPSRESWAATVNLRWLDGRIEQFATPFLYALVSLGFSGDYERDYLLFAFASLTAFTLGLLLLTRSLGMSLPQALLVSAALTMPSAPFWSYVVTGNFEGPQAALLLTAVALLWRPGGGVRDAIAGGLFALAVLVKPMIWPASLLMAVPWLQERSWGHALRVILGGAAGALVGVAAGSWLFGGLSVWREWLLDLLSMLGSTRLFDNLNSSPLTALARGLSVGPPGLEVALAMVAMAALAWTFGRAGSASTVDACRRRTGLATAIGCGVALLAAPYSWLHYYVVVAPLTLILLAAVGRTPREGERRPRAVFSLCLVLALVLASTPIRVSGLPPRFVEVVLVNLALALLVMLGFVWRREIERGP